jgi:DNA-directed RNA polymerase subunit alpha
MSRNYGGCYRPGGAQFGITLGNALRQVMSLLPGAAVTSVRVSDVHHEFSAVPHVREDMTQLILNLKQIRLVMHSIESARLRVDVQGGVVTAADLICPPEVEIKNPDLYLFTVDDDHARVGLKSRSRPGEAIHHRRARQAAIGELPVDAIFTPIKRVSYDRAGARSEDEHDRLMLNLDRRDAQAETAMSKPPPSDAGIIANVDPACSARRAEQVQVEPQHQLLRPAHRGLA